MSEQQLSVKKQSRLVKPAIYAAVLVILIILPSIIQSSFLMYVFTLTLIYIIAASSLRTIALSGQVSLGHAGFMSIGAFTAGVLGQRFGWSPWATLPLGAFATMAIAIIVGYPFARLRAIYFSMISLFFGIGILSLISVFQKYTGGENGLVGIPSLFAGSYLANYYFFLGLTVISLLILWRFESCRIGLKLKSIAQSHLLASSIGVDETGYRVMALAVGCFFVGLAGAGFAHYNIAISTSSFNLIASTNLLIYVLLGGIGSFVGPIIGTVILIIIPELFRSLKSFSPYLSAGIMILVIFLIPQGVTSLPQMIKGWIIKLRESRYVNHDARN